MHESAAQTLWRLAEFSRTEEIESPKLTYTKVNAKTLEERLGAAVGPNNPQSVAYPAPSNPHWPNAGQPWSNVFPPIAAAAISEAVNASVNATVGALSAPLAELASATNGVRMQIHGATGITGRTRLLWWRQALYSPRIQFGYRQVAAATTAVLMALDLTDETNPQTPLSVEYLLREAVHEVSKGHAVHSGGLTLGKFVSDAFQGESGTYLRLALHSLSKPDTGGSGYLPLFGVVHSMSGEYQPELFATRLGIAAETSLSIDDAAVWLFRDLQAARLLSEAPAEQ